MEKFSFENLLVPLELEKAILGAENVLPLTKMIIISAILKYNDIYLSSQYCAVDVGI